MTKAAAADGLDCRRDEGYSQAEFAEHVTRAAVSRGDDTLAKRFLAHVVPPDADGVVRPWQRGEAHPVREADHCLAARGTGAGVADVLRDVLHADGTDALPSVEEWVLALPPKLFERTRYARDPDANPAVMLWIDVSTNVSLKRGRHGFAAEHGLTKDEVWAWLVWSAPVPGIYRRVGELMRSGDTSALAAFRPWLTHLVGATPKLPSYTGVAYRVWDQKKSTEHYRLDETIAYSDFSACSTVLTQDQLNQFGARLGGHGALLVLAVEGAKHVSALSMFPDENEVVLLPGWAGKVASSLGDVARQDASSVLDIELHPFTIVELSQVGVDDTPAAPASPPTPGRLLMGLARRTVADQIRDDPDNAELRLNMAIILSTHFGLHAEAIDHLQHVVARDSENATAHKMLATINHGSFKNYPLARLHYEQALRIDPSMARAHCNFATMLHLHLDELDLAREHYEEALRADPEFTLTYNNYSNYLKDHFNENERARTLLTQVVGIDPNYGSAHYNLALLLVEAFPDEPELARTHFVHAIRIDPNHAMAHNTLAILLKDEFDDFALAKEHFQHALRIDPQYKQARFNLANLMRNEKNPNKDFVMSWQCYEEALRLDPEYGVAHTNFAFLLHKHFPDEKELLRKHYDQAVRILGTEQFTDSTDDPATRDAWNRLVEAMRQPQP